MSGLPLIQERDGLDQLLDDIQAEFDAIEKTVTDWERELEAAELVSNPCRDRWHGEHVS